MKRILVAIKNAWIIYKNPQIFTEGMINLLTAQFNFLKETADENRPMLTKLGSIYWDEYGKKQDITLLSLWCGIGESSPIDRCRELAEENAKLKISNANLLDEIGEMKSQLNK